MHPRIAASLATPQSRTQPNRFVPPGRELNLTGLNASPQPCRFGPRLTLINPRELHTRGPRTTGDPNDPNPHFRTPQPASVDFSISAPISASPRLRVEKIFPHSQSKNPAKMHKKATPFFCQPRWITVRGAHVSL
jgi:hypothetical protein